MMSDELDYTFRAMGSEVRFLIGPALWPGAPAPLLAADREKAFVLDYANRLSRFRTDSELCALNRDPRRRVPASALLRDAVGSGLWAAQRSRGLVDPTLAGALEAAGYRDSMEGRDPASLSEALITAPGRRPARPNPRSQWEQVVVDDTAGTIARPAGVRIDTGGTGKGLCADAVAHHLRAYTRFLVDCGGDIAVGGVGPQLRPYEIGIEHPLTGTTVGTLRLARGGVATSGLNVRIWRDRHGRFAHHLLDPRTGRPAWTGLIGATAVSPEGALEAETLSKMALLLGREGAREVLSDHGGLIVCDDGEIEMIGPLAWTITDPIPVGAACP